MYIVNELNYICALLAPLLAACLVELFSQDSASDEHEQIKERLNTAVRHFSSLVSAILVRRREDAEVEADKPRDKRENNQTTSERERSEGTGSSEREIGLSSPLNNVDVWNVRNWKRDKDQNDGLLGKKDEQDENEWQDPESDEEEVGDSRSQQWNDREERDDEQTDESLRQTRSKFHGAFFKNRYNLSDDSDENDAVKDESPKRWQRKKADANSDDSTKDSPSDDERARNEEGALDSDYVADFDDEIREEDFAAELPNYGIDFDYLENALISDEEKLAYLRRLRDDGVLEATDELVHMLLEIASNASKERRETAFQAIDEAEAILRERLRASKEDDAVFSFDGYDDYSLLAQAIMLRPVFYLRNKMNPPDEFVQDMVSEVRALLEKSGNSDSDYLLAKALQIQSNWLVLNGGESSALKPLYEAKRLMDETTEPESEEALSIQAVTQTLIGTVLLKIGDNERAVDAFRSALGILNSFYNQELYLAHKVDVTLFLSRALQALSRDSEADSALEEAIVDEERLYSYDEETYFAPLTSLLEARAENLMSHGQYEEALALLDRAVAVLEQFLSYDSIMSRRVLAYSRLESVLRRRACIYIHNRRFLLAANDLDSIVKYLELATKKDDDFDPVIQALIVNCMISDACVLQRLWANIETLRADLAKLFERLSPEERKSSDILYARLLTQRGNIYQQVGRAKDARLVADEAAQILEKYAAEDDGDDSDQYATTLARAIAARAIVKNSGRKKIAVSYKDLRRAKALLVGALNAERISDEDRVFLIRLLIDKAKAELKIGAVENARDDYGLATRAVLQNIKKGRWDALQYAAALAFNSINAASKNESPLYAIRVVRFWLHLVRIIRRRYIDAHLTHGEDGFPLADNDRFFYSLDSFVANLRKYRVEILFSRDWDDNFLRYCEPLTVCEKSRAYELQEERESAPTELNESNDEVVRRLNAVLNFKKGFSDPDYFNAVAVALADKPKSLSLLSDLFFSLRAANEHLMDGETEPIVPFRQTLDLCVKVLVEADKANFALIAYLKAEEAINAYESLNDSVAGSELESTEDRNNIVYMLANVVQLYQFEYDAVEQLIKERPCEDEVAQTRKALFEKLQERVDNVYRRALKAFETCFRNDMSMFGLYGAFVSDYYRWLTRTNRRDIAETFVFEKGRELSKNGKKGPLLTCASLSLFYDAVSRVACRDPEAKEFSRELLSNIVDLLNKESKKVPKSVDVFERLAATYGRFSDLEFSLGNDERGVELLKSALNSIDAVASENVLSAKMFTLFTDQIKVLFEKGGNAERRLASSFYHKALKMFNALNQTEQAERAEGMWTASNAALGWYSETRNCVYATREVFDVCGKTVNLFKSKLTRVYRLWELNYNKMIFWLRNGSLERTRNVVEVLFDSTPGIFELVDKLTNKTPLKDFENTGAEIFLFRKFFDEFMKKKIVHICVVRANCALMDDNKEKALEAIKLGLETFKSFPEYEQIAESANQSSSENVSPPPSPSRTSDVQKRDAINVERFMNAGADDEPLREDSHLSILVLYYALRVYEIVASEDFSSNSLAQKKFDELIGEAQRAFGVKSRIITIINYLWGQTLAYYELKRYTEDGSSRDSLNLLKYFDFNRFTRLKNATKALDEAVEGFSDEEFIKELGYAVVLPLFTTTLNCLARLSLIRNMFFQRRVAVKILDIALTLENFALSRGMFFLRRARVETLFLQAQIAKKKGRLQEALALAEKVERDCDIARRRDLHNPDPYVREAFERFMKALRDECARKTAR